MHGYHQKEIQMLLLLLVVVVVIAVIRELSRRKHCNLKFVHQMRFVFKFPTKHALFYYAANFSISYDNAFFKTIYLLEII